MIKMKTKSGQKKEIPLSFGLDQGLLMECPNIFNKRLTFTCKSLSNMLYSLFIMALLGKSHPLVDSDPLVDSG